MAASVVTIVNVSDCRTETTLTYQYLNHIGLVRDGCCAFFWSSGGAPIYLYIWQAYVPLVRKGKRGGKLYVNSKCGMLISRYFYAIVPY